MNPAPPFPDRRQTPRVRCGGLAKIISLPSDGLTVPGKLVNLSLGGCGIETAFPLQPGTRAEIMLRVNAASVRVLGEVHAPRERQVVGVEFLLVSACGKYLLAELMRELARQRAITKLAKGARRQSDYEGTRQPLIEGCGSIAARLVRPEEFRAEEISNIHLGHGAASLGGSHPTIILNGDELDVFI
jgi:hypothetical protein